MKAHRTAFYGVAVAGFVLAAAPLHAQQQELSEQDVRGFFDEAQQTMTQAVESGDYARVIEWTRERISDDANFMLGLDLYVGDDRKGFTSLSLDKEDVVRLGGIAAGMMSGLQGKTIEDYSLEIEVTGISPIGPNAATVRTEMSERGRLAFPKPAQHTATSDDSAAGDSASGDTGPRAQAGGAEFESIAQCSHLVQRDGQNGPLMMGLTSCQADTRLGMAN